MLCYRDRTYCPYLECVATCSRKATEEVKKAANLEGLPLALRDQIPTCFRKEDKKGGD
jgi:hypothetical protein